MLTDVLWAHNKHFHKVKFVDIRSGRRKNKHLAFEDSEKRRNLFDIFESPDKICNLYEERFMLMGIKFGAHISEVFNSLCRQKR